jgi:hypothetical protein
VTTRPQRPLWLAGAAIAIAVLFGPTGCEETVASSHVRAGELYVPGEERYDDYFAEVHSQQASADQWADDRKAAHRALVAALKLDGDATDEAIERATRGSNPASSRALQAALEQTVQAETDRAKGLETTATKITDLLKTGHDLEGHISDDFAKGAHRPAEVKAEMLESFAVLAKLKHRAAHEAKRAEDFIAGLPQGTSEAHPAKHSAPSKPSSSSAGSASKPQPQPQPKPKPKPADTGEVFQP